MKRPTPIRIGLFVFLVRVTGFVAKNERNSEAREFTRKR